MTFYPIVRFVDSISASPTTLLDLNDGTTFRIGENGILYPPPRRRRTSSNNNMVNGSQLNAAPFDDREITLSLAVVTDVVDTAAVGIQSLARLLCAPQWLLIQRNGLSNPVFARTRVADIEQLDEFSNESATKVATVVISAEYALYGLPETGSFTVNNDPTAGTNPMSYVFPTVKGDVASPLWLSYSQIAGAHSPLVASMAAPVVSGFPKWVSLSAGTAPTPSTGWTLSNASDSSAVGGDVRRVVIGSSYSASGNSIVAQNDGLSFEPGDYRVLLRAKPSSSAPWGIFAYLTGGGGNPVIDLTLPVTSSASWFDLGTLRLPYGGPGPSALYARPATSTSLLVYLHTENPSISIDLDGLLFIPVPTDAAVDSTFAQLMTPTVYPIDASRVLQIDGSSDTALVEYQSGDSGVQTAVVAGAFPRVTPGVNNILHFVPQVDGGFALITTATVISYSYYPRYLYMRPAST